MIMKMIDHPSIVKLYEVLSSERKIFMVMELVTGGELLSKLGTSPIEAAVSSRWTQAFPPLSHLVCGQ